MVKLRKAVGWLSIAYRRKKVLAIVLLVVLLGVASPYAYNWYKEYRSIHAPITYIADDKTAAQNTVKRLKSEKPGASAPEADRLANYDQLIAAYARANDFENAAKTFTERQRLSVNGLDYEEYFYAARYYIAVKDKERAQQAVDNATRFVPAVTDPERGDLHDQMTEKLNYLRGEVAKIQ